MNGTINVTIALQGNCDEDPEMLPPATTAQLREFLPDQCMLIADVDLLKVKNSKLWVHQLYVRFSESDRQPAQFIQISQGQFFHFIEVLVLIPSPPTCISS